MSLKEISSDLIWIGKNTEEKAFETLSELIEKRFGLCFPSETRHKLTRKITARLEARGCKSLAEYVSILTHKDKSVGDEELKIMKDFITVGESYFFRSFALPEYLIKKIIRERDRNERNELKVVSLGCSTGEETYSFALYVARTFPTRYRNLIKFIGYDLNSHSIARAQTGKYFIPAVRNFSHLYENYTYKDGEHLYINDDIKKMVKFSELNIIGPGKMRLIGKADLVFCRNTLIYFSDTQRKKVLNEIAKNMKKSSCLILGLGELINDGQIPLKAMNFEKSRFYLKE